MDITQSNLVMGGGVQQSAGYAPVSKSVNGSVESKQDTHFVTPVSNEQVQAAVDKINEVVQTMTTADLKFSVDQETGINVVQVIDNSTHEVIRQIPSREVVKIASGLDKLQGLLLKRQA